MAVRGGERHGGPGVAPNQGVGGQPLLQLAQQGQTVIGAAIGRELWSDLLREPLDDLSKSELTGGDLKHRLSVFEVCPVTPACIGAVLGTVVALRRAAIALRKLSLAQVDLLGSAHLTLSAVCAHVEQLTSEVAAFSEQLATAAAELDEQSFGLAALLDDLGRRREKLHDSAHEIAETATMRPGASRRFSVPSRTPRRA